MRAWRPELIAGLTRQTDLYTEHRDGQDVDAFETFITREFEELGQHAIEKLSAGSRMSPADWRRIARFVVTQDLRTPQDFIEWYARFQHSLQASLESANSEAARADRAAKGLRPTGAERNLRPYVGRRT